MDKLSVIKLAETNGGPERREVMERLLIRARSLGCVIDVGGGRVGGINIRFGSIRYAIMDMNTAGEVKVYVQPHPNKPAKKVLIDALNGYIEATEGLDPRSFPVNTYGTLTEKAEAIPLESLIGFLEKSVGLVREHYY